MRSIYPPYIMFTFQQMPILPRLYRSPEISITLALCHFSPWKEEGGGTREPCLPTWPIIRHRNTEQNGVCLQEQVLVALMALGCC